MNWLSQIFGFFRAFQCWIVVAPWESALRVRAGKTSAILTPGIHARIPFLDRIFVQSVRLRTILDNGQTMTTKDGKVLTMAVAVSYAIGNIRTLYSTVSNPELTLLCQVQALIADVIATNRSDDISPAFVEQAVNKNIPSSEWGLDQVKLAVTTFAFVRTYRLLNDGYKTFSPANDLEGVNTPR